MSTDPSVSGSVARTKEQVEKAPLPDDSKERILRIIDKAAAATNGSPDKVQALTVECGKNRTNLNIPVRNMQNAM